MALEMITASAAGTWTLGDRTVNRLGYGALRLCGGFDGPPTDRDAMISLLRRAVELGVNHIDTAAFYFSSPECSANALIREALAPYREDLVVATKVWPGRDAAGEWWWADPAQLRGQVEDNLRQLGRDHLDLVNLRLPGSASDRSLAEHFGALAELREAGLIRHLGVSNVTVDQLAEAQTLAPVVCVQNAFGLGSTPDRHEVLRACGEQGIAFVPYYAIAREGGDAGATGEYEDRLLAVAREHDVSPAQIRLAWTLHQGDHVLAVPGTANPRHLIANLAVGAIRLSAEDLARLQAQ
ncbi:aldo/keto reductase [Streptomyces sp. DSM 42041]|uniref:Aldo/keto reductase n=1 Tax=Streptomyces hazeniae TaxID=3075538 RepID=A0ABU2NUK9_9ACTN|nr:aldo/keto reductase [Streptomyces sp. DSM 42041]MDT0380410.1 aldo/keto reductase [Streptomyces sp. DSM 42041]